MRLKRRAEQLQVLVALAKAWWRLPHLRLGQLIDNALACYDEGYTGPFYVWDQQVVEALEAYPPTSPGPSAGPPG